LRFGLAPTEQSSMVIRETLTWLGVAFLFAIQLVLIYLVLP
jgi:hypothetical protein